MPTDSCRSVFIGHAFSDCSSILANRLAPLRQFAGKRLSAAAFNLAILPLNSARSYSRAA
jgi:hypothetical protein